MQRQDYTFSKEAFKAELHHILSWWLEHMVDHDQGGFIGRINGHNKVIETADKGIVLNTRILWSFSASLDLYPEQSVWRELADRAYNYLIGNFYDKKEGGFYWMLDYRGVVLQDKKQVYAQAFAIYALATYYQISGKEEALHHTLDLFRLLEEKTIDKIENGYFEAFDREWHVLEDLRMSEKDANELKTMNTHLHILEAYTKLQEIYPTVEIHKALRNLLVLYLDRFVNRDSYRLNLFFDEKWNDKSRHESFGHEIESTWLITEAAAILGEKDLIKKSEKIANRMANRVLQQAIAFDGSVYNERDSKGDFFQVRDWWPQAEAVVGFWNAYQITNDPAFREAAEKNWMFIKDNLFDFDKGEWHWGVDLNGNIDRSENKVGPWKAPYHNCRMCLQMINRLPN